MGGFGGGGFGGGGYGGVNTPFPATIKKPSIAIRMMFEDQTISSKMENGQVFTRPRSKKVRRSWAVLFDHAPQSDATAIEDFVRNTSIGGAMAFLWEDPRTAEEVVVRFSKLPEIQDAGWATQKDGATSGLSYNVEFELTEV